MDRVSNDVVDGSAMTGEAAGLSTSGSRQILGIQFFRGGPREALAKMREGGLLVVPAAPALNTLTHDQGYRDALLGADMAITDSAYMVILWNLLERDSVRRLSGLEYFNHLVQDPEFRADSRVFYVMASEESARRNIAWLEDIGISVRPDHVYVAPFYNGNLTDRILLDRLHALRPRHIVITIGGGVQERLGLYLKQSMDYRPAIHCIGAAVAFRSGDQVYIPRLADRLALGWLFRCLWRPRNYIPRYWQARRLAWLLFRYRTELPPLQNPEAAAAESST